MRELRSDVGLQLRTASPPLPVYPSLLEAGARLAPESAVVGNFDGVHLGHQALLQEARRLGHRMVAVTFRPHPASFFKKYEYRPLLPEEHQLRKLARFGADAVACLEFSGELARMEALDFARRLVLDLRVQHVVVGEDFHFGAGREGDAAFLARFLASHRVRLHVMPTVSLDGMPIHSRAIREALGRGDPETARRMLGEPYTLYGRVVHGFGWGRQLGFPTANLETEQWFPGDGVYAAVAQTAAGECYPCAFSVGSRQTFGPSLPRSLEAHLIGFAGNLYDQELAIELRAFLRPQFHFSSRDELIARMHEDVGFIRRLLSGG